MTTLGSTRPIIDPQSSPEAFPGGKVLVTGATGHIGSHVVHALARAGYRVHGTSRSQARADAWSVKWPDAKVTWPIVGENTTPNNYSDAAKDCIGIFHVAGPYNWDYPVSATIPTE